MDNRSLALRLTADGYAFERRDKGAWKALEQKPFAAANWEEGTVAIAAEGRERLVFDPTGYADPLELVLARGGEQVVVEVAHGGSIHVRP